MRWVQEVLTARAGNLVIQDKILALLLLPFVLAILAIVCPVLLLVQGRPVFYVSERMKGCKSSFQLIKLRTMACSDQADPAPMGGPAQRRVTPMGRWLRQMRIDELPQIFNVLRGDVRFIGPRPPLRKYVEAYPALYAKVFERRPGITGLATVRYHAREARLLKACRTAGETDTMYRTICIPAKARLDIFYHRNRTLGLDVRILFWTFSRLFSGAAASLDLPTSVNLRAWRAKGSLRAAS